jgi:DNA segregation ATPase FtsK/SpoIIIE-like protein
MSYKKMTIDGDEWVITWYPGLLGMQKNGVKKFVHVLRSYDCCWKLRKKAIEANGGAEGGGADIFINSSDMSGGDGGLFEQAVEFAIQDGQISTSTLQRRLKIGYARAGRLTDEMEERGIVAAKDGSKPRKCLITREEWEEMKRSTEGMS